MNTATKTPSPLARRTPDMSIEWEFQPSLQHLVRRTEPGPQDVPTWAETMPASLEELSAPAAFREALEGLSVRDLHEPDIFRAFFGQAASAA